MKPTVKHQIVEIPLAEINIEKGVRKEIDRSELISLAESINKCGLLQAVGITKSENGKFDIVFGSRRIMAADYLGMDTIAARILTESPRS